jgi:preprotein translocase subunit SecG
MLIETLLYILFVLSAFVLIVVILLQEGRGGGFGQALGEGGQQTFGVGASGINKFTGYTAMVFLVSALLLHIVKRQQGGSSALDEVTTIEDIMPAPIGGQAPPAGGGFGGGGGAGGGGGTPPPDGK